MEGDDVLQVKVARQCLHICRAFGLDVAADSGAVTPAFVRLLTDPCHRSFCKHAVFVRHEVGLLNEVALNHAGVAAFSAQDALAVPHYLPQ